MTLFHALISKFRKPAPMPTRYEVVACDIKREIDDRRAQHKPVKHLQRELSQVVCDALSGKLARDAMKGSQ